MSDEKREQPYVLAMILCDQLIRDTVTKKTTIVGSFSLIWSGQFPAVHPRLAVYVALTNGRGAYECALRFSFVETDEEIMSVVAPLQLDSPLRVAELHFDIPVLHLPQEGKYEFEFFCEGERLMRRYVMARLLEEQIP